MTEPSAAAPTARRIGKFFAGAVLAGVAVVVALRAAALVRGEVRTARSETRYFEWAFGPDGQEFIDALTAAAPSLPEGATVCLDALPHRRAWTRIVASYVLPGQDAVVSTLFRGRGSPPCRRPEIAPGIRAARSRVPAPDAPSSPWRPVVRDLLGIALAAAAGWRWTPRGASLLEDFFLAAWVGSALTIPIVFSVGLAGLPVSGPAIAAVEIAIAFAARYFRRPPNRILAPRRFESADATLLALPFAVFVWKIVRVPLWCWDHHAVWGLSARRLFSGGFLELAFLGIRMGAGNSDYPLGLPLLWRVLTLGGVPATVDFKLFHLFFGASVVLLTRRALRRAGVPPLVSLAAAAFVAVSPLLWDSESLGIADVVLAAAALAAICLRRVAKPWVAGAMLGFLPWIKKEGLPLAILFLAVLWLFPRGLARRSRLAAAASFAILAAGAVLVERFLLPPGLSFFAGDWTSRVSSRLPRIGTLSGMLGGELAVSDWLGFWFAAALALGIALVRRLRTSLALFAVVLGQTAVYAFTYLATYLTPYSHVDASFFRLMSALLPVAAVAMGLLAAREPASSEEPL